ncbi:Putative MetA-pathway of phenol degradation [Zobellia uliginosa]|uniref:MetA-pathway of phenol degradation n=1 Tax=Zobellia uliginosa TaxID=143224 RepID=A0ABY1KWW6_9FLAO|nr:transporter [Zobellia uliginosa]SIS87761.1 Putative MetA-pathway of phenol degradation [Zobellia uliginosa]
MHSTLKKYLFTLLFLFSVSLFSQGAWTKAKNEAYVQLSFYNIAGYSGIYGNPDYRTERKITDNTLQLFGEYGISDKTTVLLSLPVKMIKAGDVVSSTAGVPITSDGSETTLGNLVLGVKHQLYNNKWAISGQLNVEANTGSYFEASGLRSGYDTYTLSPKLNIGRGYANFFVQASTGVDIRFNDYSSSYRAGAEVGVKPIKRLWLIGFLDFSTSFENGDVVLPEANRATGFYLNDQEYLAYGIKGIVEITQKFGVLANYTSAISGTNVPKRAVLGGGIYHKF